MMQQQFEPTLTVAMIQPDPPRSADEALTVGLDYCRRARAGGADIVLFPEIWSTGYRLPESESDLPEWRSLALDSDSPFVRAFQEAARVLSLIIALTFLGKGKDSPTNTVILIDRTGSVVHRYDKVHLCSFGPEKHCEAGRTFPVTEVETAAGPVKIGTMICFDREFPESARLLMLGGAEIILVPNACPMEQNRRNQLQSRAFENMTGIALANYASGEGNGRSVAFDGIAFEEEPGSGLCLSRDQVLAEGDNAPGIVMAGFPLERMREYRNREVWGSAWRRPETYGELSVQNKGTGL